MTALLIGKDYPHLCSTCRAAIDLAALLLVEDGPDAADEDIEAPIDYVYDHGLYCGGRKAICTAEPAEEESIPWYFIQLDGEDVSGFGQIEKAIERVELIRDRLNLWCVDLKLVDDVTGEILYIMRQDRRGRTTEDGSLDALRQRLGISEKEIAK